MKNAFIVAFAGALVLIISTDARAQRSSEQNVFWESMRDLCGNAYEGRVVESPAEDRTFTGKRIVLQVGDCGDGAFRMRVHVGSDRSRRWTLSRNAAGLVLRHAGGGGGRDDRGGEYGGESANAGTKVRQEFRPGGRLSRFSRTGSGDVWTIELHPRRSFAYTERRGGSDDRLRIVFDLTKPVTAPTTP